MAGIIGKWKATTQFLYGNLQGNSQEMMFRFYEDGTVTTSCVQVGILYGRGVWFLTDHGTYLYSINEDIALPDGSEATLRVMHEARVQGLSFVSYGQGCLYTLGKPTTLRNTTRTQALFVSIEEETEALSVPIEERIETVCEEL